MTNTAFIIFTLIGAGITMYFLSSRNKLNSAFNANPHIFYNARVHGPDKLDDKLYISGIDNSNLQPIASIGDITLHLHSERKVSFHYDLECKVSRPSLVLYRRKVWQYTRNKNEEIIAYQAYFDHRPILGNVTWIRIHVVVVNGLGRWVCQFWCPEAKHPTVSRVYASRIINAEILNGTLHEKYSFSCKLPANSSVPSHVSLAHYKCSDSTMMLPVFKPESGPVRHEFGICVTASYGSIPPIVFAEWLEFHHLLGVTEFNVYDTSMENMTAIFKYYKKKGLLIVRKLPPPIDTNSFPGIKLARLIAINDCMLRNMFLYRYTLIIDMDEIIIPRMHSNYSTMMNYIHTNYSLEQPSASYVVHNTYFFRHWKADTSQPDYLRTAQFRHHSKVSSYGFGPKSFIDPSQCLVGFNHYCALSSPRTIRHNIVVHPDIARSHHYRLCGFSKAKCEQLFATKARDDIALKFAPKLKQKMRKVLRYIDTNEQNLY